MSNTNLHREAPRGPSYDPGPLLVHAALATDFGTDEEIGATLGVSDRTIARWRNGGRVTERVADRAALLLGLHPCNLWPDEYQGQCPPETPELAPAAPVVEVHRRTNAAYALTAG